MIYEKSVRDLMHDMVRNIGLHAGETLTRQQAIDWFRDHYPKIKLNTIYCHLTRLSTNLDNRISWDVTPGRDDLFFNVGKGLYRLYEPSTDPVPIYDARLPNAVDVRIATPDLNEDDDELSIIVESNQPGFLPLQPASHGDSKFALEGDLQDYLVRNLGNIEDGLELYSDDRGVSGIEFNAGGRFIDILARDRANGYVVIELKVSKSYDKVVGQVLRYTGWIAQHLAKPGEHVRGMIIAHSISQDLRLACLGAPNIELIEYELQLNLKKVQYT